MKQESIGLTDTSEAQMTSSRNRVSAELRLLEEAQAGRLDDLACIECKQPTVAVWFTHPGEDIYRTWFSCRNCGFGFRAQNATRPAFFSEDRIRADLQETDRVACSQAIFEKPSL